MDRRSFRNLDYSLLICALSILVYGCLMIYSASKGGKAGGGYIERQCIWAVIGLVLGALVARIDTSFYRNHAGKLYGIMLFLLVLVLAVGHSSKGAQRWLGYGGMRIQPSELAKVVMIVALAVFFARRHDQTRDSKTFLHSLIYMAIPTFLVFKQPDLGTSLVLFAIWVVIAFAMGTNAKNILILVGSGAILALIVWNVPGVLKDYQKNRVITFVNPSFDQLGTGYHVMQSRIAIGSGQLGGRGFMRGTQRELSFIPEQHTDFIFTVVGEEFGFVGAMGLLLLYLWLLWRVLSIMAVTEDPIGRGITAGVFGMLLFHIFVNIGMTLGLVPVAGVPLPMFSYGGSSLLTNFLALGLVEGVAMRPHRINF